MHRINFLIILVLLLGVSSCATTSSTTTQIPTPPSPNPPSTTPPNTSAESTTTPNASPESTTTQRDATSSAAGARQQPSGQSDEALAGSPANDDDAKRKLDEALAELRASDDEWRQNDAEFRKLRQNNTLPENNVAVAEFAEFVAALRRKMLENCYKYRTVGGDPDRLGFDCGLPKEKPPSGSEMAENPEAVQSEQEKTASLEGPLSKSLGEFDKTIQERQEKIRGRMASLGSSGNTPVGSGEGADVKGGKSGSNPGGGGVNNGEPLTDPDGNQTAPGFTEAGAGPGGKSTEKSTGPKGEVARGGSDDDVVARQLREAAEREQDPVMKEKLWDEYRKYKASKR